MTRLTAVLPLVIASVSAEAVNRTVAGTVTHQGGPVIAGAKIILQNEATGLGRELTTN